jgi:hypothetical protein
MTPFPAFAILIGANQIRSDVMSMQPFQGASGQYYDFALSQLPDITRASGVFILAKMVPRNPAWAGFEPQPVFVGQADSIYHAITTTTYWNIAKLEHDATLIYVRLRADTQARQTEVDDLVAKHQPPMNMAA